MHVVTGTGLQHLYFAMESMHIVLNRSVCFLNVFCSSLAFNATFVFSSPGYIASWKYSRFIFHIMLQPFFFLKSHNTHNDNVKKCLGFFFSDFCKFIKNTKLKHHVCLTIQNVCHEAQNWAQGHPISNDHP